MTFQYYLFDLDNCLIKYPDLTIYFDDILIDTFAKFELQCPSKEERYALWDNINEYGQIFENWQIPDARVFWDVFDELDISKRKIYIADGKIRLFNDSIPILEHVKELGIKSALISNSPGHIVEVMINEFKIGHFFDYVLKIDYTDDIHTEIVKPKPNGVLQILENLQCKDKNEAILIGDAFSDIEAAKRAKISACLLNRNNQKNETLETAIYKPDFIINSLLELKKFSEK